jgi:hypothetical protein
MKQRPNSHQMWGMGFIPFDRSTKGGLTKKFPGRNLCHFMINFPYPQASLALVKDD